MVRKPRTYAMVESLYRSDRTRFSDALAPCPIIRIEYPVIEVGSPIVRPVRLSGHLDGCSHLHAVEWFEKVSRPHLVYFIFVAVASCPLCKPETGV